MKKAFVFVVCGDKSHIETLNFSLQRLKSFSKEEIIVVTDLSRNKGNISHGNVIDIQTKQDYTNHQASIFLKTGLNQFLPKGVTYCYLDSDVLALNSFCDQIFDEFISPIRFGADHCTINLFSPIAMKCDCQKNIEIATEEFSLFLNEHKEKFNDPNLDKEKEKLLHKQFEYINSSFFKKMIHKLNFRLSKKRVWINREFYFNKQEKTWFDRFNKPVLHDIPLDKIIRKCSLSYNPTKQQWLNAYDNNFWTIECNHLIDAIKDGFDVNIEDRTWQHWNGGVFLFNDESDEFLTYWHKATLKTFSFKEWKTRDQGTLALSAWKFGLQNQTVLDKKWNFIADDNNKSLAFNNEGYFTENDWKTKHKVNFVHVYHRFGDKSWALWNHVANI